MSQTQILPYSSGSGGGGIAASGPDKPRVAYQNLLRDGGGTVTASSETAQYEYQNAYDDRPFTWWRPESGTSYLTLVLPSARSVNYFAFYGTDLAAKGGSIQLQYSLDGGGSWLDAAVSVSPADTTPVYKVLTAAIAAARWRFKVICATQPNLACLSFGTDLQFERGCWVGFSPPRLARDTDLTNNISQRGVWLGRSIIRNGMMGAFDLDKLTPGWVETYWKPFVRHAETKPWFLLWNKTGYPADAAWCWAEGDIERPAYSHPNFMKAGMRYRGRTDDT